MWVTNLFNLRPIAKPIRKDEIIKPPKAKSATIQF